MSGHLPPSLPGGLPAVERAHLLQGGDVAEVWDAVLTDGRHVVIKTTATDARLEAEGLAALSEAAAPCPAVLAVDDRVLVIEHVTGPPDEVSLGAALAALHQRQASAFGWDRDNVIGPLPQANAWDDDWARFYADQRLRPHLEALPAPIAARLEAAVEGPLPRLLARGARPSLVHGDLWAGNIVAGRWLIDPAVHFADRELDLAMLDLFGGVPAALQEGYDRVWPLDEGWQDRRPALQLYHLLVHVRLFGSGYLPPVVDRLDRLGW